MDWRRVARRTLIGSTVVFALINLAAWVGGGNYGIDFHQGTWPAAWDLLHGRSPFPPADPTRLLRLGNAFVTPPFLGAIAIPFAVLPYGVAIVLWNALCVCSLLLALRLLEVRELRFYALALASVPLIDSLEVGQPDALFALAAAVTWRYRASWPGAVALGALVAAKLIAVPLLVWLLVTRRIRSFLIAAGASVAFLVGSWALIGFDGLASYPRLLAADARAFEASGFSFSLTGALIHTGATATTARWLAIALAAMVAFVIVTVARERDEAWFVAAMTFGLLISPLMWPHYLTVLLVLLAITKERRIGIWLIPSAVLWIALHRSGAIHAWIGVIALVAVSICVVARGREAGDYGESCSQRDQLGLQPASSGARS